MSEVIEFYGGLDRETLKSDIHFMEKETNNTEQETAQALHISVKLLRELKTEMKQEDEAEAYRREHGIDKYEFDQCVSCGRDIENPEQHTRLTVPNQYYKRHIVLCDKCAHVSRENGVNI